MALYDALARMELLIGLLAAFRAIRCLFARADGLECLVLVAIGTFADLSVTIVESEQELARSSVYHLLRALLRGT